VITAFLVNVNIAGEVDTCTKIVMSYCPSWNTTSTWKTNMSASCSKVAMELRAPTVCATGGARTLGQGGSVSPRLDPPALLALARTIERAAAAQNLPVLARAVRLLNAQWALLSPEEREVIGPQLRVLVLFPWNEKQK